MHYVKKTKRHLIGQLGDGKWFVQLPTAEVCKCFNYASAKRFAERLDRYDNDSMVLQVSRNIERHSQRNISTGVLETREYVMVHVDMVRWPARFVATPGNGKRFVSRSGFELRSCMYPELYSDSLYGVGYSASRPDSRLSRRFTNKLAAKLFIRRLARAVREYNKEHHAIRK